MMKIHNFLPFTVTTTAGPFCFCPSKPHKSTLFLHLNTAIPLHHINFSPRFPIKATYLSSCPLNYNKTAHFKTT